MPDNTDPFAYRFLRPNDTAYWQRGDPDIIWQVTRNNLVDNAMNYGFLLNEAEELRNKPIALVAGLVTAFANMF